MFARLTGRKGVGNSIFNHFLANDDIFNVIYQIQILKGFNYDTEIPLFKLVLGILPKTFSQLGDFPIGTVSQVSISQLLDLPSDNLPKVRLGLPRRHRLQWGPSDATRMG